MNLNSDTMSQQSLQENQGDERSYSIREIATDLGETVHVVRNWLRDLRPYIVLYKTDSGFNRFGKEALETIRLVQRLHRQEGLSMKEVEYYLATNGSRKLSILTPPPSSSSSNVEPSMNLDYQGLLAATKEEIIQVLSLVLDELQDVKHELKLLQDSADHRTDLNSDNDVNREPNLNEEPLPQPITLPQQTISDTYLPRSKRSRRDKMPKNSCMRRVFSFFNRIVRM